MSVKKPTSIPESPTQDHDECILLRSEVQAIVRLPTATLYAHMANGKFPRPIQLGTSRRVGWLKSEIMEWVRTQPRSEGRVTA